MLTDSETRCVYFSKQLLDKGFHKEAEQLFSILDECKIPHALLEGTADIWCRDYMPVQVLESKFIQFRYEPSYLNDTPEHRALRSNPMLVCKQNKIDPLFSNIKLDGGNVVKGINKVILTNRVFHENYGYKKHQLLADLESLFEARVIIIPQLKSDFTGHADGLIRFFNDDTVLINELSHMPRYWQSGIKRALSKSNLHYIEIPTFQDNRPEFTSKYPDSAIGIYINFLEVNDLILLPFFNIENNRDEEALTLFKNIYPHKKIRAVEINEIAKYGGLLNCISWNIRK